jgi:hypothetical protein
MYTSTPPPSESIDKGTNDVDNLLPALGLATNRT